jgi:hypothetical protein
MNEVQTKTGLIKEQHGGPDSINPVHMILSPGLGATNEEISQI